MCGPPLTHTAVVNFFVTHVFSEYLSIERLEEVTGLIFPGLVETLGRLLVGVFVFRSMVFAGFKKVRVMHGFTNTTTPP